MSTRMISSPRRALTLVGALAMVFAAGACCEKQRSPAQPQKQAALPAVQAPVKYPFTFVVFGDTRRAGTMESLVTTKNDEVRPIVIRKIAEMHPEFLVSTGDLVVDGASKEEWRNFDSEQGAFREKNIPYYPVLGNHEYRGSNKDAMENYFARFPHLGGRKWYGFKRGNCAFVLLDSSFSELSVEEIQSQKKWLAEELARLDSDASVAFVFVAFHHPPFTNSKAHSDDRRVQEEFLPLVEKYGAAGEGKPAGKVCVVFEGHCHSYERFIERGLNHVVTAGGGAPVASRKKPADRQHKDVYAKDSPRGVHFCALTVWEDRFEFKTFHLVKMDSPEAVDAWQEGDFFEMKRR
jgi:3',5'-cyclic AMP phosphodiesterase CpdA